MDDARRLNIQGTIAAIKGAIRSGETLAAYDLALQELQAEADAPATPEDRHLLHQLQYFSVLALVRSGATQFADKRYRELGLEHVVADGDLGIDIGSLRGRIAKDRALAATHADERRAHLERAIDGYQTAADKTDGNTPLVTFPLVNVAALCLWLGDRDRSHRVAKEVIARLAEVPKRARDYWLTATGAEAHLLLGDLAAAAEAIADTSMKAGAEDKREWQNLAVTVGQLRHNCRAAGIDDAILAPLQIPPIVVYAGDRAGPNLDQDEERRLAEAIETTLAEHDGSWSFFGGLRAGFEILLAEAVIARKPRGAELNVVLPFPKGIFLEREIRPHGERWVTRFEACLEGAKSCRCATEHGYVGATVPHYARRLAMGYAILLAQRLGTDAIMIVGTAPGGDCHKARSAWIATGRTALTLAIDDTPSSDHVGGLDDPSKSCPDCIEGASLFGDFTGFSQLSEDLLPLYADRVLGGIASVLDQHEQNLAARNSWGDAIVAQFYEAQHAARCAIALQRFLGQPTNVTLAKDVVMRMRIGLHYGPVQHVVDPVQKRKSFFGKHVVQAARIEPVAIPGMIYVSEPFAAALAVDNHDDFVCDYLGIHDTAKKFGKMSLYALRTAREAEDV